MFIIIHFICAPNQNTQNNWAIRSEIRRFSGERNVHERIYDQSGNWMGPSIISKKKKEQKRHHSRVCMRAQSTYRTLSESKTV